MSVPKPTPKAEIVIDVRGGDSLTITCASADARARVERDAPEFGTLLPFGDGVRFVLYVFKTYDAAEVAKYLGA